jgi:hypothetical protein
VLDGRGATQDRAPVNAEARRIIAGLVERIPAIEAPQVPGVSPETLEDEPERQTHSATVESQESVQRPWWRRVSGR